MGTLTLAVSLSVPAAYAAPHASPQPTVVATPVPTPEPSGTPSSHPSGGPLGFLNPSSWIPNPKQWAADVFSQVLVTFLQSIANGLRSLVNGVMRSNLNFIMRTPPAGTYDSPTVHTLWNVVRGIAKDHHRWPTNQGTSPEAAVASNGGLTCPSNNLRRTRTIRRSRQIPSALYNKRR